jgi:hypothetical protein
MAVMRVGMRGIGQRRAQRPSGGRRHAGLARVAPSFAPITTQRTGRESVANEPLWSPPRVAERCRVWTTKRTRLLTKTSLLGGASWLIRVARIGKDLRNVISLSRGHRFERSVAAFNLLRFIAY